MWLLHDDPSPREASTPYSPFEWEVRQRRVLPIAEGQELAPMAITLEHRRSVRSFAPLPNGLLGSLLWHGARTKESALSTERVQIEHRMTPSAGAIHPIHLLVQLSDEKEWARYNSQEHSLDVLANTSGCLYPLIEHCEAVLPRGGGLLMIFVAEPGKTAAKYEHPESLIWRDAGILQGSLGLVAASLGLSYCLLGITGNPWVSALSDEGKLQGVGVSVLGARP